MNFEEIIRFENEHTKLDFKKSQYVKGEHQELLKDILAMANVEGFRHIIIGVKVYSNGEREFESIENFIDAAVYQQLVRENIEPDLNISYEPFIFEDNIFGIFTIGPCNNQPYMMRKDYGTTLRLGDSFIRKGTHKSRLPRPDIDIIMRFRIKTEQMYINTEQIRSKTSTRIYFFS